MIELPVIPATPAQRKPDWLRVKLPVGKEYRHVSFVL
ncbi:MAG: lipoyl synthase [Sphingobacterium sp.]|nr:lipoyl synthase [Sphingobacterium sp.]